MTAPITRLPLSTLELWKSKAEALDKALEFLEGRVDSELVMKVYEILKAPTRVT